MNKEWITWILSVIAVAAVFIIAGMHDADARPMSNSDCSRIAQDFHVLAEMRDRQADQKETEAMIDRVLRSHLGEEDSYVQFETDIQFMVNMVSVVWASKETPDQIATAVYSTCKQYGYGVGYKISGQHQTEKSIEPTTPKGGQILIRRVSHGTFS